MKNNIVCRQTNQSVVLSITLTVQKLLAREMISGHQQKRKSKKDELKKKIKRQKIIQNTQRSYFKHVKHGETHA